MAYFLHVAFQNLHIQPGVFMGLRTQNEKVTEGERAFMLASIKKALTEGDIPIKVRNFTAKKEVSANGR